MIRTKVAQSWFKNVSEASYGLLLLLFIKCVIKHITFDGVEAMFDVHVQYLRGTVNFIKLTNKIRHLARFDNHNSRPPTFGLRPSWEHLTMWEDNFTCQAKWDATNLVIWIVYLPNAVTHRSCIWRVNVTYRAVLQEIACIRSPRNGHAWIFLVLDHFTWISAPLSVMSVSTTTLCLFLLPPSLLPLLSSDGDSCLRNWTDANAVASLTPVVLLLGIVVMSSAVTWASRDFCGRGFLFLRAGEFESLLLGSSRP